MPLACLFAIALIYLFLRLQLNQIQERLNIMPTKQELDAKLAEEKQAIADAAKRVSDKIAALVATNPDLSDELASVQSDIDALAAIAPATPPTP